MSRVQLALNVDDIDQAVAFYTRLFGAEPAKRRPGYANFAITEPPLKLVLLENPGHGGTLNHLGVEVSDVDTVEAEQARLAGTGLAAAGQRDTTCCYAVQDKVWVTGPGTEPWEVYVVKADSDILGKETESVCCTPGQSQAATATADTAQAAACC